MKKDYSKFDELVKYMKNRGIDKNVSICVILICKTNNQKTSLLDWLKTQDKLEDYSRIIEKCLEIRETIT